MKNIRDIEKLLKKEELKYNDDEEIRIEEFDRLGAEIDNYEEILEDFEIERSSNEEIPIYLHDFDEGSSKLEEHELEAVDRQSRKIEIERIIDMKIFKSLERGASFEWKL